MAQLCNPARTASDTDVSYESKEYWYTEWMGLANTEQLVVSTYKREYTFTYCMSQRLAKKKRGPLKTTDAEQDYLGGIFYRS